MSTAIQHVAGPGRVSLPQTKKTKKKLTKNARRKEEVVQPESKVATDVKTETKPSSNDIKAEGASSAEPPSSTFHELAVPGDASKIQDTNHRALALEKLASKRYAAQPEWLERGPQMFERTCITFNAEANILECNGKPIQGSKRLLSTKENLSTSAKTGKQKIVAKQNKPTTIADSKSAIPKRARAQTNQWLGKVVMVLMMKNESAIIERMIDSVADHIDAFIVTDTGSTDDSVERLWKCLVDKHKKPGEVYLCPFESFGTTRTVAVQLAYETGDWLLLFDADYKLEVVEPDWKKKLPVIYAKETSLGHDPRFVPPMTAQHLLDTTGNLQYARPHLVRGDILWCYHCRTHEFLAQSKQCPSGLTDLPAKRLADLMIDHVQDGGAKHDKSPRDIMMLLMDLMDDPKSARAMFYLANSYSADGCLEHAMKFYKKAMNECGWYEEMFCATKEAMDTLRRLVVDRQEKEKLALVTTSVGSNVGNPSRKKKKTLQGTLLDQHKDLATKAPVERLLIFCLSGLARNPHRLESLKSILDWADETESNKANYSLLAITLASFFTFNARPMDRVHPDEPQKLFVDLGVHDFGLWYMVAKLCRNDLMFQDFGIYAANKAQQYAKSDKGAKVIGVHLRWEIDMMVERYEARMAERKRSGMRSNKAIRDFLLAEGERAVLQNQYARGKEYLQEAFSEVVSKHMLTRELVEAHEKDNDPELRHKHIDSWKTDIYHRMRRLTAWKNASSVYCKTDPTVITESDTEMARACCLLAKAQHMIEAEQGTNNYLHVAAYYLNALKYNPDCYQAKAELHKMQREAPSNKTRVLQKLLHFATDDVLQLQANRDEKLRDERRRELLSTTQTVHDSSLADSIAIVLHPKTKQRVFAHDMALAMLEGRGQAYNDSMTKKFPEPRVEHSRSLLSDPMYAALIWESHIVV